jgi:TonB family protein
MNYHFLQTDFLSRRALAFSGIVAFHVLIAYLLLTALVQGPPRLNDTPTVGFVIQTPEPQPPPRPADFRPTERNAPILVPAPEPLAPAQDPTAPVARALDQLTDGSSAAVAAPLPTRTVGTNQLPNSEEYYPPDMRRQNVEGTTNVRVCVDPQGKPLGDPMIEASSGYSRLDVGAVNVARHGRFARSMQGDVPVGNCFRFRIAFKIPK